MTANQLEYNKLVEQARHNRATEKVDSGKLDETRRSNIANEMENRRANVTKENLTRETNASKINNPWGLISLAGERAVYGTDQARTTQAYVEQGPDAKYSTERRMFTANPLETLENIYDSSTGEWGTKKKEVY